MIKLFKYILFGHVHKWKIVKRSSLINHTDDVIGYHVVMQCEVCGDVKGKELT